MEIFDYERWRLHLDSNYVSKEIRLVFYCLFFPCILCTRNIQWLEYFILGGFKKTEVFWKSPDLLCQANKLHRLLQYYVN